MRHKAFRQAALGAVLTLSLSSLAWANDVNTRALELAGQNKFEQALSLLSQQDEAQRSGYEHRFLNARVLSWAGQYDAAQAELDSLIQEFPGNPDVQLALGNLAYYQTDLETAERYYQTVVDKFPNYQDAQTGLKNVRKAKAANKSSQKKWRIDGGVSVTDLTQDGLNSWNNQFLRIEYTPSTLAYSASIQRYDRFGSSDVQLRAGLADAIRGGWDWGIEGGFTPDSTFRPDFSAGGRVGHSIKLESGTVLYPNIDYRYDEYDVGGIHTVQPGLTAYLDKGIVLTGRLIGTVQDAEDDQLGWLIQGRMPVTNKLEVNLGFASAPEAIDGLAISTESYFGGLTYAVRDDLDIHVNLAHDDRENSFERNSLNVGFTHKR